MYCNTHGCQNVKGKKVSIVALTKKHNCFINERVQSIDTDYLCLYTLLIVNNTNNTPGTPPLETPHPAVPLQGRNQKSNSPGPIWALTFIRLNTEYPLDGVSHWLALQGQHLFLTGPLSHIGSNLALSCTM